MVFLVRIPATPMISSHGARSAVGAMSCGVSIVKPPASVARRITQVDYYDHYAPIADSFKDLGHIPLDQLPDVVMQLAGMQDPMRFMQTVKHEGAAMTTG